MNTLLGGWVINNPVADPEDPGGGGGGVRGVKPPLQSFFLFLLVSI